MAPLLQTFIIQNVAFDEELFQDRRHPYPELSGLIAVDTIANCYYCIKIVE